MRAVQLVVSNGMNSPYDADNESKRRRRERMFEDLLGKALEGILGVAKFAYKTIEEIDRKVDQMEVTLTALETALGEVEVAETDIEKSVVSAGNEFKALVTEIEQLSVGSTVSQAQIDAITSRAQAVETGLTNAAQTLTSETPAEQQKEETKTGGASGTAGTTETVPTLYTYTPGEGVSTDDRFTTSGFQIPNTSTPLLVFSGDIAPGEENGAQVAGYSVYTGPTEAVPAS